MMSCFLVSSHQETWLCHSLVPLERMAKFPDDRIAKMLQNLPARPGAAFAYMEACDVDCDVVDGRVVEVRHLSIDRSGTKITLL